MSHYHVSAYTSVSSSELDSLRRDHAELQVANQQVQNLNRRLDAARDAAEQTIRDMSSKMSDLSAQVNVTHAQNVQLHTQLRQVVVQQDQRLKSMSAKHQAQLQTISKNFRDQLTDARSQFKKDIAMVYKDVATTIEDNNRAVEKALQSTANDLQNKMGQMQQQLSFDIKLVRQNVNKLGAMVKAMKAGNQQLLEMAREYRDFADRVFEDVQANCPHYGVLCKAECSAWETAVAMADDDINIATKNAQNASAAHGSARDAFVKAMTLRETAYAMEAEWQEHYQMAQQALIAAEDRLEDNRKVVMEGKEFDVDYWTFDGLRQIEDRVKALRQSMPAPNAPTFDIKQLDGLRDACARASVDISQVSEDAYVNSQLSQDRADAADDFAEILRLKFGLENEGDDYYGNDQRRAHRIRLRNPATNLTVVITQEPGHYGDDIGNRYIVDVVELGKNMTQADEGKLRDYISQYVQTVATKSGFDVRHDEARPANAQDQVDCRQRAQMGAWIKGTSVEVSSTKGDGVGSQWQGVSPATSVASTPQSS